MNTLYIRISLLLIGVSQLLLANIYAETTSCTNDIFKKNSCDICYTGGDIAVTDKNMTFPETKITWENTSETLNHNIYKASQNEAQIITDIGTTEENWYETAITWGETLVWSNFAGVDRYILASKQKIDLRQIKKDTAVTIKNFKSSTTPVVLKVPIKYHEIETGSFTQGDEKISNYCVSYIPKISTTSSSTNTNTSTTTQNNNTTTNTNTNTQNTNTTTNNNTTTTTSSNTSDTTTPKTTTEETSTTTEETSSTIDTNEEIPAYNAKVTLNSAGTDPLASEATHVATGPAENMLVLMAAILLSLALFPKINALLNK